MDDAEAIRADLREMREIMVDTLEVSRTTQMEVRAIRLDLNALVLHLRGVDLPSAE